METTSLAKFYPMLIDFLIGAGKIIGFILIAFIALKLIMYVVQKILKRVNPAKVVNKLNESEAFGKKKIEIDLVKICLPIVKWFVILIFIIIGAELLQLEMISSGISSVISIMPKVFSAVLIFVIGVYLAVLVKMAMNSVMKSLGDGVANIVSTLVFYVVVIFVSVVALEQIGVNTDIVKSNITLIFGSILVTFTISFGLGSKEIVTKLLLGFYTKKTLTVGNEIQIDDFTGIIFSIDPIFMVVKSADETNVYPIKEVSEKNIKILN